MEDEFQQRLARFVSIEKERREKEDELKRVERERNELEKALLQDFSNLGMESARVDGLTVFLRREVRASAKDGDTERLCDWFVESGLGSMVKRTVHPQTLSAFVRECESAEDMPDGLAEVVNVFEQFNIRTRKS